MYLTPVAPDRSTFILPYLPPQLYQFVMQMHGHKTPGPTSISNASDFTMVSAITGTTSPGTGLTKAGESSQKGKLPVQYIKNLKPVSNTQQLLPMGVKLKDSIGICTPPDNDKGNPMCLLYHVRGGCWSLCSCHDVHREQSQGETTKLQNYMKHQAQQL